MCEKLLGKKEGLLYLQLLGSQVQEQDSLTNFRYHCSVYNQIHGAAALFEAIKKIPIKMCLLQIREAQTLATELNDPYPTSAPLQTSSNPY